MTYICATNDFLIVDDIQSTSLGGCYNRVSKIRSLGDGRLRAYSNDVNQQLLPDSQKFREGQNVVVEYDYESGFLSHSTFVREKEPTIVRSNSGMELNHYGSESHVFEMWLDKGRFHIPVEYAASFINSLLYDGRITPSFILVVHDSALATNLDAVMRVVAPNVTSRIPEIDGGDLREIRSNGSPLSCVFRINITLVLIFLAAAKISSEILAVGGASSGLNEVFCELIHSHFHLLSEEALPTLSVVSFESGELVDFIPDSGLIGIGASFDFPFNV